MSAAPGPAHSPTIEPSTDHRLDVFLHRSRAVLQHRVGEGRNPGTQTIHGRDRCGVEAVAK